MLAVPPILASFFALAIGHDPNSLKMAVVNDELDASLGRNCSYYATDCSHSMLSCLFLRFINNESVIQVYAANFLHFIYLLRTLIYLLILDPIFKFRRGNRSNSKWATQRCDPLW